MDTNALQQLRSEYEHHKSSRANVEATWDQIEKFVDPLGNGSLAVESDHESSVMWKRTDVWDFTAIQGSKKLKATIHGTLTNPAVQWFTAEFRDVEMQKDQAAREWLEDSIGRTYQALQDSDFNSEIPKDFGDLVDYGNGFIVCEGKSRGAWDGLDFTSVPVREGYYEPDSVGGVRKFFRRMDWSARQIVGHFDGENIPENIRDEADRTDGLEATHEVVFCVFPREGVAPATVDSDGNDIVLSPEKRPFGSVYFLAATAEQVGLDDGYYDFPAFHSPWDETSGSQWGHGVGGLVLPTVKLLNALWETYLGAAEKAVDPGGFVSDRAGVSAMDLGPGKWTVAKGELDKIFKVIESGARFDVTIDLLSQLQGMIRRAFHEDELQLKDSPAMTATEAAIRFEIMNRVMGSTLALVTSRQLVPILRLVMAMLRREGQLKPMPESLKRSKGEINIVFLGPLARAQRTDEVSAIERGFSFAAQARKMGFEEAADYFNAGEAMREVLKRLGVPATCVRSQEEAAAAIKARKDAIAAAQAAELARARGEAAEQAGLAGQALRAAGTQPGPAAPPPMLTPTLEG